MPAYNLVFFKPTVPYKVIAHGNISIGTKQVIEYRGRVPTGKHLAGNITESLAITNWMVVATRIKDGDFAGMTFSGEAGTTYSIPVNTNEPCNIELSAKIDTKWKAGKRVPLNVYVIPSNTETTPHLFKVTTAGVFGDTEAAWNLSGTTTQGTVIVTYVGTLPDRPISLGPKNPG